MIFNYECMGNFSSLLSCYFLLQEVSFKGGKMKFSKYMDYFPFPYYIVLRKIEALHRTLVNLLRQVSLSPFLLSLRHKYK